MNNGVEFGHGAKCSFFLPQRNGPWLLFDPSTELQRFRSLLGNVDSRKLLCWKDMGEAVDPSSHCTVKSSVNRGVIVTLFCFLMNT